MDITFATLNRNGQLTDVEHLTNKKIDVCPNIIMMPDHYHDGTCDCFKADANHMKEWGYVWNDSTKQWGG